MNLEIDPQKALDAMRDAGLNTNNIEDTCDFINAYIDQRTDEAMPSPPPGSSDEQLNQLYSDELYTKAAKLTLENRGKEMYAEIDNIEDELLEPLRDQSEWFLELVHYTGSKRTLIFGLGLDDDPLKDCDLDEFITLNARFAWLKKGWEMFYEWKDYFYDIDLQRGEVECYKITGDIFNLLIKSNTVKYEAKVDLNEKDLAERKVMEENLNELKAKIEKADKEVLQSLQGFVTSASEHYELSTALAHLADKAAADNRYYYVEPEPMRFLGMEYRTKLPDITKDLIDRYFTQWAITTNNEDSSDPVHTNSASEVLSTDERIELDEGGKDE